MYSLAVSNTNSLATVTWEDFVSHIPAFRNVADRKQLYAIKSLGVLYCIITLGFAVIVSLMSGVIECAMLTSSATSGPLVGVFLLAMLIPIANAKGAATGMIAAHMTTFTLAIGNQFYKFPPVDLLPTSIEVGERVVGKCCAQNQLEYYFFRDVQMKRFHRGSPEMSSRGWISSMPSNLRLTTKATII